MNHYRRIEQSDFGLLYQNNVSFINGCVFFCTECSISWGCLHTLSHYHEKIHRKAISMQCAYCLQGFRKLTTLLKHLKHHSYDPCKICSKNFFKSNLQYNEHVENCKNEKFYCSVCEKGISKKLLNKHVHIYSRQHVLKIANLNRSQM